MGQLNNTFDTTVTKESEIKSPEDTHLKSLSDLGDKTYIKSIEDIFRDYKEDGAIEKDLLKQTFEKNGFISGELWEQSITLQARILSSNINFVSCECLIDKENKQFELREFPFYLFSHLNVKTIEYVLIKLREKPGSSRIDILKADNNIIDKSFFDTNDLWTDIKKSGIDQPFQLDD